MPKSRSPNFIFPKSKEIERILDNLTKYPVCKVPDKKLTQSFGRLTWTRNQKRKRNIFINNGVISIPHKVILKKNGKGFEIKYR